MRFTYFAKRRQFGIMDVLFAREEYAHDTNIDAEFPIRKANSNQNLTTNKT